MPHRHCTWLGALALSLIALAPLRAQTGLTPQDSLRLDSLDGLRRELVRANEARPKYGIPMIDRFFRYEPVAQRSMLANSSELRSSASDGDW